MSRGPGWIQRRLLEIFERVPDQMISSSTLVCLVYDRSVDDLYNHDTAFPFNEAELVAVRRALRGLAHAGKIKTWGRGWHQDNEARWSSLACPATCIKHWDGKDTHP